MLVNLWFHLTFLWGEVLKRGIFGAKVAFLAKVKNFFCLIFMNFEWKFQQHLKTLESKFSKSLFYHYKHYKWFLQEGYKNDEITLGLGPRGKN